jgi:prepilin peptidase CpaA
MMSVAEGCAVAIALVACHYDLATSRIPNKLTFTTAALAIVFHLFAPYGGGWSHSVLGLLVGLLVFFPLFALGAMGAGDVKLMAAVGAWIGATAILNVALYGSVAGGVLALIVALRQGYLRKALTNVKMLLMFWWVEGIKPFPALTLESTDGLRLPYALAIAAGLAVTLWQR